MRHTAASRHSALRAKDKSAHVRKRRVKLGVRSVRKCNVGMRSVVMHHVVMHQWEMPKVGLRRAGISAVMRPPMAA